MRAAGLLLVQLGELRALQREVVHQAFLTEDEADLWILDVGGVDRLAIGQLGWSGCASICSATLMISKTFRTLSLL